MTRRFLSDQEYSDYFFVMGNVREAIAGDFASLAGGKVRNVLDIASGHGLFAFEVSHALPKASVCATGLEVDKKTFLDTIAVHRKGGLTSLPRLAGANLDNVTYLVSDVTSLPFKESSFDASVNFLGLEDVRMTKGNIGVKKAILEAARVTKKGGIVEFAFQVFGDSPVDILSKNIMEEIGHGAVFLDPGTYETMMNRAGLRIKSRIMYSTGGILTARQAREELKYTCEETSKVYGHYGVETRTLYEIWKKFGGRIRAHGYALYTDILAIFSQKS